MRKIYLILLFLFTIGNIDAQIDFIMTTDKDTIEAGQSVLLTLDIRTDNPSNIAKLDFSPYSKVENLLFDSTYFDEHLDLAFVNNGGWPLNKNDGIVNAPELKWEQKEGKYQMRKTLKVAIYNFGVAFLPFPEITLNQDQKVNPFERPAIAIIPAGGIGLDSMSMAPIKEIFEEPTTIEDFYPILIGLLGLLFVAGIFYYFSKRATASEDETAIVEEKIIIPAHIKAINALTLLDKKKLWQSGYIKEYQSELTHIIREYLEERYDINALEMTTSEISKALINKDFDKKYTHNLNEILTVADLVKFAKSTPEDSVHDKFLKRSIEFVENTKKVDIVEE